MQDLLEPPINLSIFSMGCDVANGKFHPHILSNEAIYVDKPCDNQMRLNVITCKDKYLHEFVNEVDGLSLNTKLFSKLEPLPRYIPVFDTSTRKIPILPEEFSVVATTLRDIISSGFTMMAGSIHEERRVHLKLSPLSMNCFYGKRTILFNSGPDTIIESMWYRREEMKLFEKLSSMGFYAATGLNFSLINGECAFSQTLNLKRSLHSAYLMEKAGLQVIPHVYGLTKFHADKWITWFTCNPQVTYFVVNCQLQKTDEEIATTVQLLNSILNVHPRLRMILQGFRFNKLDLLGPFIDNIHFADMHPLKRARSKYRIRFDYLANKWIRTYEPNTTFANLFLNNLRERKDYIDKIRFKISGSVSTFL